jgi:hypothetical protein
MCADGVSCLVTWLNDYWNKKESVLQIIIYFCLFLFCKWYEANVFFFLRFVFFRNFSQSVTWNGERLLANITWARMKHEWGYRKLINVVKTWQDFLLLFKSKMFWKLNRKIWITNSLVIIDFQRFDIDWFTNFINILTSNYIFTY